MTTHTVSPDLGAQLLAGARTARQAAEVAARERREKRIADTRTWVLDMAAGHLSGLNPHFVADRIEVVGTGEDLLTLEELGTAFMDTPVYAAITLGSQRLELRPSSYGWRLHLLHIGPHCVRAHLSPELTTPDALARLGAWLAAVDQTCPEHDLPTGCHVDCESLGGPVGCAP